MVHAGYDCSVPGLPFALTHPSGLSFRGDVHLPEGSGRAPVVVLCHGFKGFKDWGFFPWLAEGLAREGFAAVRMNFALNGIADDPLAFTRLDRFAANTITQELADLDLLISTLKSGGLPGSDRLDPARLGLLGHSLGGGVVLLRALEDPGVRAVATWSSVERFWSGVDPELWRRQGHLDFLNSRTNQVMRVAYGAWEDIEAHPGYDFGPRLNSLKVPLLLVHGSEDPSVPCAASGHLAALAGSRATLHLVDGGDHAFGASMPFKGATPRLEEALGATSGFFRKAL